MSTDTEILVSYFLTYTTPEGVPNSRIFTNDIDLRFSLEKYMECGYSNLQVTTRKVTTSETVVSAEEFLHAESV